MKSQTCLHNVFEWEEYLMSEAVDYIMPSNAFEDMKIYMHMANKTEVVKFDELVWFDDTYDAMLVWLAYMRHRDLHLVLVDEYEDWEKRATEGVRVRVLNEPGAQTITSIQRYACGFNKFGELVYAARDKREPYGYFICDDCGFLYPTTVLHDDSKDNCYFPDVNANELMFVCDMCVQERTYVAHQLPEQCDVCGSMVHKKNIVHAPDGSYETVCTWCDADLKKHNYPLNLDMKVE